MSKGKRKRKHAHKHGHHHAPSGPGPEEILAELEKRLAQIEAGEAEQTGAIWGATHKLLLKTSADPRAIARIIATRDAAALAALLRNLRDGGAPTAEAPEPASSPVPDIPPETLRKAMHAFRKRLKLTRLDHESKLGVGPMTGGRKADVDAILPPREFPEEVWEALVAAGQLRAAGQGFYALGEEGSTSTS